jgi:hypothetical protein
MHRLLQLLPLVVCLVLSSGCAICCAPFDCDYPYVGGRWVRTNPSSGRVGSAFDEAGAPTDVVPTAATGQPTPARPSGESLPAPQMRSVIPRNMGQQYLPTSP